MRALFLGLVVLSAVTLTAFVPSASAATCATGTTGCVCLSWGTQCTDTAGNACLVTAGPNPYTQVGAVCTPDNNDN